MGPRLIPLGLAAACYVLALVQRPGTLVADTKVDLHVDPAGFLADVASAWTPTGQLGHVFGGQYGGYLFPMAPFFALGDLLSVPTWLVHRLWLGTLLALAAWGVVRLLDDLLDRPRGAPHVAAAVLFVLNPYVAIAANRISVALLAYAALPWLLLAIHRGLRRPRSWRWPALFALALTCTGGGINAALVGWLLLAPVLLVVYERTLGGVGPGALRPFLLRLLPAVALANAWWVVPVVVHARYGLDFLPFTEQPGTIWQTTSVTESLRLMGFWASYVGFGFGGLLRPYATSATPLHFEPAVLVASLLVPALALTGFAWTRRWRYGPWFLLLTLLGLVIMVAGFPDGTPSRKALTFVYNHVEAVRFLRTTYKAGPLVALGVACLGGAAFGLLWARLRSAWWRAAAAGLGVALAAVAAWPLIIGHAPEKQLAIDGVPSWWRDAARAVDRLPPGERAVVLPGQLFAFYDWGGTWDPILPVIADRPVAERFVVPFSDLRAVELLWATDDLVTQERLVPGQLPPLLDLLGAGLVVSPADRDRARSAETGPLEALDQLAREPALAAPDDGFGPARRELPVAGRVRPAEPLPRVAVRDARTGGLVRLLPRGPLTVVDGSAAAVVALAGFGDLDPARPLAYAADINAEAIRRAAREGGPIVITDTNRRRAYAAARMRANTGPTLPVDQSVSEDGALLTPFDADWAEAQTVALVEGVRSVTAPSSPQGTQFPEHRPFAAIDGDPSTAWLANRTLELHRQRMTVKLDRPRRIAHVDLLPYDDRHGVLKRVVVNGRKVDVHRGWNRIRLEAGEVDEIVVAIDDVEQPDGITGGAGGVRELRIPGVRAVETLRPPVLAERALRGDPAAAGADLTYLLSRTTVDAPWRSGPPVGPFQAYLPRDRVDPERVLARTIAPPAVRRWRANAWVSPDPRSSDADLDRLAGAPGGSVTTSSGRYMGLAAHRASGAFDGTTESAWIGPWLGGPAWLRLRRDRPFTVRRLRLAPPRETVRAPEVVRIRMDGAATGPLRVGPDGAVAPDAPLRGRELTIEILEARFPRGATARERQRRAVGIAEVEGAPTTAVPRTGPLRSRCSDAAIVAGGQRVGLRAAGDVADLDRGVPLRAEACAVVGLPEGEQEVLGEEGLLRVDQLRLRTEAGEGAGGEGPTEGGGAAPPGPPPGRVLDPGEPGRGRRDRIRLDVTAPAWLVLGESYNRGWRATCDGEDLGDPVPLQGYANGWRVTPGCGEVDVAFAPNGLLPPAYVLSLLACLGLLALALRREGGPSEAPLGPLPDDPAPRRLTPRAAALAGLAAGLALGFVFAIRAGVVIAPAVALLLWRGVDARRLALAGGGLLLVAVPVLYLAIPGSNPGGYNSRLPVERIAAHWVGVAAVILLGFALWRTFQAARSPPE